MEIAQTYYNCCWGREDFGGVVGEQDVGYHRQTSQFTCNHSQEQQACFSSLKTGKTKAASTNISAVSKGPSGSYMWSETCIFKWLHRTYFQHVIHKKPTKSITYALISHFTSQSQLLTRAAVWNSSPTHLILGVFIPTSARRDCLSVEIWHMHPPLIWWRMQLHLHETPKTAYKIFHKPP